MTIRSLLIKGHQVDGLVRAIGLRKSASVLLRRALRLPSPVNAFHQDHLLSIRPLDSDLFVVSQIFGNQEYEIGGEGRDALNRLARLWRQGGSTPVIVDAGANVGYSTIYLRDRYPEAVVAAVEPDPQAYEMLISNCAGLDRIVPFHGALWDRDGEVALRMNDGPSWSRGVLDGGGVSSITLRSLLARIPRARLLMLKMDIEGAELEATRDCGELLCDTPCIVIEPHDFMLPGRGCLSHVFASLAGRKIDSLMNGEKLILIKSDLLASAKAS